MNEEARDWWIEAKRLTKQNQKLQQRLNRITNLMIGNERIWALDRLAMELEVEADMITEHVHTMTTTNPAELQVNDELRLMSGTDDAELLLERVAQSRADALFLRRLEWDLGELHVAVRGDTARRGGRYDQSKWRGERP